MVLDHQHTRVDRAAASVDSLLLSWFSRCFFPVRQALRELPDELRRPAFHLMEGLYKVQRDDREKASLLAAAEYCRHKPTGLFRITAFLIAVRGALEAVIVTVNNTSRKSRAALGKYLVRADEGQRPWKAGFECADSRCATEASGENIGDAFAHRSPGLFDAIASDLSGLGEGVKKTVRLALDAQTPWINAAPHFGCSALKAVYQSCRKKDGIRKINAVQLEDYNYGRQYEWLVETVEERIRDKGFDAYQEYGLDLEGAHDEKFVNAMAVELGFIVGRMTTEYLQTFLGNSDYRPAVVVSTADPGRSVSLFNPSQQRFCDLPAAGFPWPFYLSGVDRVMGLGESRRAAQAIVPFPYEFPALMRPLENARKAIAARQRRQPTALPAELAKRTRLAGASSSLVRTSPPRPLSSGPAGGAPLPGKAPKIRPPAEPVFACQKGPMGLGSIQGRSRRLVMRPGSSRRNPCTFCAKSEE